MTSPRWLYSVVTMFVVGVCLGVSSEIASDDDDPSASVAEQLRHSTVHIARGAEGTVDVDRAERLIGDRPIVVIGVTPTTPFSCIHLEQHLPDLAIVVVSTDVDWPLSMCGDVEISRAEVWSALQEADLGDDRTAYVAEVVWQFDAQGADGVEPRRAPIPPLTDHVPLHKVFFLLLFGAAVTWFLCESAASALQTRWYLQRFTRAWRAQVDTRLNRLADVLLRPDWSATADERAATGQRYVLLLHDVENAHEPTDRRQVDQELTKLERIAGLHRTKKRQQD